MIQLYSQVYPNDYILLYPLIWFLIKIYYNLCFVFSVSFYKIGEPNDSDIYFLYLIWFLSNIYTMFIGFYVFIQGDKIIV